MGLNFRKSKKVGPFRFTVSKRGVSASAGVPGARITKSSTGRTTTTVGIPGSGLYYSTSRSAKSGHPSQALPTGVDLAAMSKAERRELAALATDEDKRLAWMGKAANLSPVQMAYRWQVNTKVFRWLGGPLLALLGLMVLVLIL